MRPVGQKASIERFSVLTGADRIAVSRRFFPGVFSRGEDETSTAHPSWEHLPRSKIPCRTSRNEYAIGRRDPTVRQCRFQFPDDSKGTSLARLALLPLSRQQPM